jgi:hypothetical protein
VAGIALIGGTLGVPARPSLVSISGQVERAYRSCSKGGCSIVINLHTPSGQIGLYQGDYPGAAGDIAAIHRGDDVTAFASQLTSNNDTLSIWALSRDDQYLMHYENTVAGALAKQRESMVIAYLAGISGVASLIIGIWLGIRRGTFRASA